jgi:O-acetylhomoserine (thiol)-lyase
VHKNGIISGKSTHHPATAVVKQRLADLEDGVVAVASGQAASTLVLLNIVRAGEHIAYASTL